MVQVEQITTSIRGLPEALRLLDAADVTVAVSAQIPDDWWSKVSSAMYAHIFLLLLYFFFEN